MLVNRCQSVRAHCHAVALGVHGARRCGEVGHRRASPSPGVTRLRASPGTNSGCPTQQEANGRHHEDHERRRDLQPPAEKFQPDDFRVRKRENHHEQKQEPTNAEFELSPGKRWPRRADYSLALNFAAALLKTGVEMAWGDLKAASKSAAAKFNAKE